MQSVFPDPGAGARFGRTLPGRRARLAASAADFVVAVVVAVIVALVSVLSVPSDALAQQQQPEPAETETPADAGPQDADAGAQSVDAEVDALIRVLEDDEARARLIERLQAASDGAPAEAAADEAVEETLAGKLAQYTRQAAESTAQTFAVLSNLVDRVADLTDGAFEIDVDALRAVVLEVAFLVAAVFAVFIVVQLGFRRLQRGLAETAALGDFVKRAKMIGASSVLDASTVAIAWTIGYAAATQIGRSGQIGLEQSLFLNAFLIIELIKTAARAALSPRWTSLRPTPIDDTNAAYWYFWLSRLVSLVGYTFWFVAPILAARVTQDIAETLRIAVMLAALVIAVAVVLQNRDSLRARLMRRSTAGRADAFSRLLAVVARVWHVVAIAYLVGLFVLWLADPGNALPFVLSASWKSIVAILLGALLATFIDRMISGGMRLPDDVKARLPLLEERLNAFVPGVLRVVRVIVTIAVAVTILEVWDVANVSEWLRTGTGQRVVAALLSAALILLGGGIVYVVVQSWIEYRLNPNLGRFISARERTLLSIARNAFTVVLGVLVFMLVLAQLGVNIGPLLAGAGVVGLAIGFGAQKLVQDVINGVFIQLENTLNEGDVVQLGGIAGVVERLTIRSVSLRSLDGTYHMIPFSSVDSVSNFMKHFSYHLAAIGVSYRENIAEVKEAMLEAFELLNDTGHAASIIGEFEMQGVVEFASSSVVVRGRIKTLPGLQWEVGRAYNEIVKQVFDRRGIAIALPHMTIHIGEDKDGNAPPLRIRQIDEPSRGESSGAPQGGDAERGENRAVSGGSKHESPPPGAGERASGDEAREAGEHELEGSTETK